MGLLDPLGVFGVTAPVGPTEFSLDDRPFVPPELTPCPGALFVPDEPFMPEPELLVLDEAVGDEAAAPAPDEDCANAAPVTIMKAAAAKTVVFIRSSHIGP